MRRKGAGTHPMANEYLVVSDLHLTDVEDNPDGWKAYKASRFTYDPEFAALLRRFCGQAGQDTELTLVLNGDIFDFDLVTAVPDDPPWPVNRSERRRGLNGSEPKSMWKLQRILGDHPGFTDTLADFLAAGHRIVYVLGNHDREFHFPGVQNVLRSALREGVAARGGELQDDALVFEPWFFHVSGEIYAEHGQQYDYYTSFRYLLSPVVLQGGEERLALPMGNLSNRYLMSKMGFFNPHASDYILNLFAYAAHWFRHYAFSRRSLAISWLWGSLVVIGKLLRIRKKLLRRPRDLRSQLEAVAGRYDLPLDTVRALYRLQQPPITSRFFRIIREFWIDRALMAVVMTGGTVALALVPIPLWIKLMVPLTGFPLLYFIYEWAVKGRSIHTIEREFPDVARRVADLVDARVVTFGHTHVPRLLPLRRGLDFVDTGTWAPITDRRRPDCLVEGYRNLLRVSFSGATPRVHFESWIERCEDDRTAADR